MARWWQNGQCMWMQTAGWLISLSGQASRSIGECKLLSARNRKQLGGLGVQQRPVAFVLRRLIVLLASENMHGRDTHRDHKREHARCTARRPSGRRPRHTGSGGPRTAASDLLRSGAQLARGRRTVQLPGGRASYPYAHPRTVHVRARVVDVELARITVAAHSLLSVPRACCVLVAAGPVRHPCMHGTYVDDSFALMPGQGMRA